MILINPTAGEEISLLTDMQRAFIDDEEKRKTAEPKDFEYLNLKAEGDDFTVPAPVKFNWEFEDSEIVYLFEISEYEDFSESRQIPCKKPEVEVYNLCPGMKYYWRVLTPSGNVSETSYFYIKYEAPRCIYVPSLVNVRDMGGWKTKDGYRIRQGLVLRGCEMDMHQQRISDDGIKTLLEDFKIKTDIDLRFESIVETNSTPLGKDVKYIRLPCKSYGEFFNDKYAMINRQIIKQFTKRENYPIYLHCQGGADRTGTVVFLLGAILGMYEDDMVLDWEFSSLSVWGLRSRNARRYKSFREALAPYGNDGNIWMENAMEYMRRIGISEDDFEKIRDILLEK